MTAAPGGRRQSEWLADLEELADLAAETVGPQEVGEARRRRRGYSGERLASVLSVLPGEEAAAAPAAQPRPAVRARRRVADAAPGPPGQAAAAPPGAPRALVPVWVPSPPTVTLPHPGQALAPLPHLEQAGEHPPAHRRLLVPGLALLGAAALCAGLLLRLPGPDPATPLGSGPAYSTPSPQAGSAPLQPAPAQAAPVQPGTPDPTLSPPAPAEGAASPVQPGPVPAAAAGGLAGTAATRRAPAGPPPRASSGPGPLAVPATTGAAPSPTAVPTAAPTATPGAPLAVRSVSLSMGTCEDRGAAWVCPETATFVLAPGAHGTLHYHIVGSAVSCSGASSPFDRAQPDVDVPAGTTTATVTSALVFPAGAAPSAAAPGGAASSARVEVISPNPVTSASQTFGATSCP